MKIYELYLTYSIIIISPAPDRDWDGALHVVPNLSQQAASSARDRFFEIGLFREPPIKHPQAIIGR